MNKKFYSILAAMAIALTLFFGFGPLNTAKAAPDGGDAYTPPPGQSNLFGYDQAANSTGAIDRDQDRGTAPSGNSGFVTDSYGLNLKSQQ